jgi:hypothetical protein
MNGSGVHLIAWSINSCCCAVLGAPVLLRLRLLFFCLSPVPVVLFVRHLCWCFLLPVASSCCLVFVNIFISQIMSYDWLSLYIYNSFAAQKKRKEKGIVA